MSVLSPKYRLVTIYSGCSLTFSLAKYGLIFIDVFNWIGQHCNYAFYVISRPRINFSMLSSVTVGDHILFCVKVNSLVSVIFLTKALACVKLSSDHRAVLMGFKNCHILSRRSVKSNECA